MTYAAPETTAQLRFALVYGQTVSPDGAQIVLASVVERIPELGGGEALPVSLFRAEADGALEQLRPEGFQLYGSPLWAPGGEGALIPTATSDGGVQYVYVPFAGEPLPLPLEPAPGIGWGR